MDSILSKATPAFQVIAVAIAYFVELFQKLGGLFSFATGITSID